MLSLGKWLTDSEYGAGHLLARVIINRLWHYHFGQGIVKTPNDFGIIGSTPSHPNLLDWLAGELIKRKWKLKPIQKLLKNSGFQLISVEKDISDIPRCIVTKRI